MRWPNKAHLLGCTLRCQVDIERRVSGAMPIDDAMPIVQHVALDRYPEVRLDQTFNP